jgi:hypothetical protein
MNNSEGGAEFEPRSELEKIMALENYMEWRKDTMTRRQANKAKNIVDDVVSCVERILHMPYLCSSASNQDITGEEAASGGQTLDTKKISQQFKAISGNVSVHPSSLRALSLRLMTTSPLPVGRRCPRVHCNGQRTRDQPEGSLGVA